MALWRKIWLSLLFTGAVLVITDTICYGQACAARFGFTINQLSVAFHDSSTFNNTVNYFWRFGDGSFSQNNNPTHTYQLPGEYFVRLRISNPNGTCLDSTERRICLQCVFPGDANADGIVNNEDVLYVGISYGSVGPVRHDTSTAANYVASTPWVMSTGVANLPSGINIQHADCDGNGIINRHDIQVINKNYGRSANKGAPTGCADINDIPLYFEILDSIPVGAAVSVAIKLGTTQLPATDVYGISFSVNYDNTLIKAGTVDIDYNASLFGTPVDVVSLSKDFEQDARIESAIGRIDHNNQTIVGNIGTLNFVMEENLAQKTFITEVLNLSFSNITLIRSDESLIPVCAHQDSAVVFQKLETSGTGNSDLAKQVRIYPNPANELLNVAFAKAGNYDVSLMNVLGKQLMAKSATDNIFFDVSAIPKGVYFLIIRDEQNMTSFKIEITR